MLTERARVELRKLTVLFRQAAVLWGLPRLRVVLCGPQGWILAWFDRGWGTSEWILVALSVMPPGFAARRCCNAVVKWRSVASTRMNNTCCPDTILLKDTYNSLIISGKVFYLLSCFVTNLARVRLLSVGEFSDRVSFVALFLHFRIASVITVHIDWHWFPSEREHVTRFIKDSISNQSTVWCLWKEGIAL
jgi:hypothetical protein